MNLEPPGEPIATQASFVPLTAHRLRFTVEVETAIHFHDFKGSALRGALTGALRRHYCPYWRNEATDPLHRRLCPVCQLLSWEHDDVEGGDVRRPFALLPPFDDRTGYEAGERFCFSLTLFGDRLHLLPYLTLGVHAMGETGIGRKGHDGRRGRFRLVALDAVHPLTRAERPLYRQGEATVQTATLPVTHADVLTACDALEWALEGQQLTVQFHTPLRLSQGGRLVKTPDFFPFIKQVALRVLDLSAQHAGQRPETALARDLYPYADAVALAADETRWWDLAGYSGRLGRAQPLGGLVGRVVYRAADWRPLLPWLVWGQVVQVGKNTVKGCGCYSLCPAG